MVKTTKKELTTYVFEQLIFKMSTTQERVRIRKKRCYLFKRMFHVLCIFNSAFACTPRCQLFTRAFVCTTFPVPVRLFLHVFQDVNLRIEAKMSTSPRARARARNEMLTEHAPTSPLFTCTPRCQLLESVFTCAAHAKCARHTHYEIQCAR